MNHCDEQWQSYTVAYALSGDHSNSVDKAKPHIESCSLCQILLKFTQALVKGSRWRSGKQLFLTLEELSGFWADFIKTCLISDDRNRRFVVKQGYCFCGERASTTPLPLRETLEQRANSECSACGARWRVAHCRQGCGAPLDDRFDELCDKCKWIKCPAGHCSNADCDD